MSSMTKKSWIKSYEKTPRPPHWAETLIPSRLAKKFLFDLKKEGNFRGKFLEIGCGNGRDSLFFAQNGVTMVAIDFSRQALTLARHNKQQLKSQRKLTGNISFRQADAEKLPFKSTSFSGIYSIGVLHSTHLKKSLTEIARVLRPGGTALLHLWQKTYFLKTKKTDILCVPKTVLHILSDLPFKVLKFQSDIKSTKIDYEENQTQPHRHTALIIKLRKL